VTLGRDVPELPCDVIFAQEEWQAAWIVSQKKPLPPNPPTLGEMILIVARFGGFLARKNDGNPGAEALWRGLELTYNKMMPFVVSLSNHIHTSTVRQAHSSVRTVL
jgi:hypothetical protein